MEGWSREILLFTEQMMDDECESEHEMPGGGQNLPLPVQSRVKAQSLLYSKIH